ncbi:DoxX family protein [Halosegnis marinus]|uniref:DoxX family protein n=1 Tax=Halosegnis marinus TaxID=3034023 RepID=A0ABD5ZTJ3_9EURY|nr:DoxX family protein [Halosegnis sp. DT85]
MIPLQTDVFAATGAAEIFLLARIVFGVTLAFMGLNHFLNLEEMTGYAQFKGLPAPGFSVVASGATLVLGGLGLVVGAFPVLAAGALATFLLVSAVTMHDFWSIDDPEEKQNEMISFQKNVYGAGAALAFLVVGGVEWTYAVGIGLF